MPLQGKNLIAGEWSASGSKMFKARSPAAGSSMEPEFVEVTPDEIERAMSAAEAAFHVYRQIKPEAVAAFLEKIGAEITALGQELVERASSETALPSDRIVGERGRTVNQLNLFAQLVREGSWVDARIDRAIPDRKPLPKPDVRLRLLPIGPVVVFCASNFPLAFSVAGGDTASALAAGCPVVVKANRAHPGTADLVAQAIAKAIQACGMPPGVFSLLQGANHEIGLSLVRHPRARAAGFTGSQGGGRALFDAAAQRPDPIPVYAEMGSVNPVFLLPGALKERGDAIAEGLKGSVTLGNGQFCTKPGVVFGMDDVLLARFIDKLGGLVAKQPAGTLLHSGIFKGYEKGVAEISRVGGVRVVVRSEGEADPKKTQVRAAVFATDAATFLKERRLHEEVFGPATLVVRCGSREELEKAARAMEGHLTATLHGTEADLLEYAGLVSILETKVGRLVFNGFPTGVEVCPSMNHGGPYPATTDVHFTSVGTAAIYRWARPVCYQNFPQESLPEELRNKNVRKLWRTVDGKLTQDDV